MYKLPKPLIDSLINLKEFSKESFEQVHASGQQVTSIRFNPAKWKPVHSQLLPHDSRLIKIPWSSYGYYLPERPSFTFDPLFHAGVYYVQEASSMFLEQALVQTVDLTRPLRILDLCAAPGGKSTLLQSLISQESLLISNEVIKARAAVLEENSTKWGGANMVVTNNDPAHFARLENYFDVMVIDAPCSGSGLFRRDPEAITEWSENAVQLCSQRQQRIIADAWPALKQDGILIYSTCSYSKEEDEDILDWMQEGLMAEGVRLAIKDEWNIVETLSEKKGWYGYRFYPDKVQGEGFFIAAMRKKEGGSFASGKPSKIKLEKPAKAAEAIATSWLQPGTATVLFKQKDDIIALPAALEPDIPVLQSALYIKKAGITLGKLAGDDLIPAHALAVSTLLHANTTALELNKQQAIQYLRREEFQLDTSRKGWALVTYQGYRLGWIKILANRFNNYYPKEWRVMKQPL